MTTQTLESIKAASAVSRPVTPKLPSSGRSPIAFVGEAPGADEVIKGEPFVGPAGRELNLWLRMAGLKRDDVLITNVFKYKPVANKIGTFFMKRTQFNKTYPDFVHGAVPYNSTHGYMDPNRGIDLEMLREELDMHGVKVVVGLGAIPLWAFTGFDKIGAHRGTVFWANEELWGKRKFIGTWHPAGIIRGNFDNRPYAVADIKKAVAELETEDIQREPRTIWMEPLLDDLEMFKQKYIEPLAGTDQPIAFDIETNQTEITCIGFSPTKNISIVVPFVDTREPDKSYWPTPSSEVKAWMWVKSILEDNRFKFLAHNGSYDIIWLAEKMGIFVNTPSEDTMHMHHALEPELPKSLGVLASIFTNEGSWKHLVSHSKEQRGNKRDE